MKRQDDKTDDLIGRWLEAQTTDEEERAMHQLCDDDALPAELRTMLEGFAALAEERAPRTERTAQTIGRTNGRSDTRPLGRRMPLRIRAAAVAIAATLILGAVITLLHVREPYCYIDGVAVYDKELAMQTTRYLDGFAAFQSPDRMVDELIKKL